MKPKRMLAIPLFAIAALTLLIHLFAQAPVTYQLIATIPLPGVIANDITWVDQGSEMLYLADRTAAPGGGRIDVVDTQMNKLVTTITGFVGTVPAPSPGVSASGPNGVVAIPQLNQLYVGDGDSTVKVVDLAKQMVTATIPTGGKGRADELAYDPVDHIIMIANPSEGYGVTPFLTFISTDTQKVLGTIPYPGQVSCAPPGCGGGLEQPVWDGQVRRFLLSIPATTNTLGAVDSIDPKTMTVVSHYTVNCSPAGLALGPIQRVMTSCGAVIDGRNGNRLAIVSGPGGDEIWFNPGDNRYYFGANPMYVVDAETNQVVTSVTVGSTHALAVDSNNNHVFVPVTGAGIKVYSAQ